MIKILAIDDNSVALIRLKAIVKDAFPDSVLHTTSDGLTGIELAVVNDPDVILLDIFMPGFDGFEVCRRLKQDKRIHDIPVVFITDLKDDKESRIKALEAGAEGFLPEPIDQTELTALIRAMVKIKASNVQIRNEKERLAMLVTERTKELEKSQVETLHLLDELKTENEARRKTENALRENIQLFQGLFNASPDAIILIDPHGTAPHVSWPIVDCNKSACLMNGYTREELVGQSIDILNASLDSTDGRTDYYKSLKEKGTLKVEAYHRHKKGHLFPVEVLTTIVTLGGREMVLGIDRDITERKLAEKALQESEYFFKQSQRAAFIGSYKLDLVNNVWDSSEVLDQIFGINHNHDNSLRLWNDLLHPENKEIMEQYFSEEVLAKRKPFNKEYRIIRRSDGETRWVYGLGELTVDEDDELVSMIGTIQDITERKLAEETSREAEERFRMVFENVFDGIVIYEEYPDLSERKLIDCNEQYAAMAGMTREELFKLKSTIDIQKSLEESSNEVRLESLSAGKAFRGTYSWIRPDGKDNIIEFTGVPVMWRGKLYSIGIDRDITYRKRAEESLRESNELNNSLLKTIPFGMDIVDEEGNILFQNENLEQLFGRKLIGRKCWDLYCDEKSQCVGCPLLSGINIGKTALYETKGFMGGRTFQISHTGMVFQGKKAMLEIFQDITERKQSEMEIKTLGRAIQQGPSSIVITNSSGKIEFVNDKFTEVTQYKLEEVRGKNPRIFNPGHIPTNEFMPFWETLQKGNTWKGEVMNRRKDKSRFWEEVTISALIEPDGMISNYVLIMNDITEKKQMLNNLIAAKEKAEESDRLKSAFLANMSHEIRTPLNSIIGFSELMADPDYDPAQQIQFAQIINSSGNNLLSIISDIMDISKIEAGQVQVKKQLYSVNQLVADIQKEYYFKAIEKGIDLVIDPSNLLEEVTVESDETKVRQILVNFVGNAIKFTKEGHIGIGFKTAGDFVQFHVKDTGIGIPKDYHDKVFERFRQVESANTRKYGGNGLGLAISKSLVELLGGRIWMESEQGKGSTFYFTIPK
jgi:PAS domain S-box-containing protein